MTSEAGKIEVDRDALLAALQQVVGVVSSKNTIPVLGNLLLVCENGRLAVTGTDLDLEATASVEAGGALRTTVPKDKMLAAITSFRPGALTIAPPAAGKSALTIRQGRGQRTLPTLSAADFPKRERLADGARLTVPAASLLRLLDTCQVAMDPREPRAFLQGLYLHTVDGALRAVGTDGHRMVRADAVVPDDADEVTGAILSAKGVGHLRALLAKREGAVSLTINATGFDIEIGATTLIGRLIDGTFPDYSRSIPAPGDHVIRMTRDDLLLPASSVAAVIDAEGERKWRCVVVEIGADGAHQVSARDQTGADANEPIDVEAEGGTLRFGVNHKYLATTLGIFAEAGTVTISMRDANAPMLVTSEKDPDLLAVIMPMRA